MKRLAALLLLVLAAACQTTTTATQPAAATAPVPVVESKPPFTIAPDVTRRVTQLPRTVVDYDRSLLNDNDRAVVAKLIDASKDLDEIFWRQVSEQNPKWRDMLSKGSTPLERAA